MVLNSRIERWLQRARRVLLEIELSARVSGVGQSPNVTWPWIVSVYHDGLGIDISTSVGVRWVVRDGYHLINFWRDEHDIWNVRRH